MDMGAASNRKMFRVNITIEFICTGKFSFQITHSVFQITQSETHY